jgi:hypothetical protein
MRRFVTLVFLLLFTVPFGISISGCSKKTTVTYCNGADTGPVLGQVHNIVLGPQVFGVTLNFAQIGQVSAPAATDCKGTPVTVASYTYATLDANGKPDMTIADVVPSGASAGKLCAGTWNRNTGGGIPDFTTCNPTNKTGTAYVVASAGGAGSNLLPVFVHPVVTSVVLGNLSTDCINDPATNCSPAAFTTQQTSCTINPANGCCTAPVTTGLSATNRCISQGTTSQLAARVYQGTDTTVPGNNISCQVGHLSYSAQTAAVVNIDENGVATAQSPGSTIVNANISNAGSSAGFFSTCPPVSIALSIPGVTGTNGTSIVVNPNNTQPINVVAKDMNGMVLTNLNLEFLSTTPTTIPAAATGTVTPAFPGAAAITAICQPPACNPSPFSLLGLLGNGKPVSSSPVDVITPGLNSTVLYIGSTQSQYILPVDFTANTTGLPVRLPYTPNSMVISDDGSTIYMGSSFELMTFASASNALSKEDQAVNGTVLAVSPDNTMLVMTDPVRQLVYLYSITSGAVQTTYGGVATHAEFTPDNQTVYITLGNVDSATGKITPNNQLLVHSTQTGWYTTNANQPLTDIAITVPSVGAFFAGTTTTARGYCPITTVTSTNGQTATTNVLYPDAGVAAPPTDRLAATNDGLHILGATTTPTATLTDLAIVGSTATPGGATVAGVPTGPCPDAGLQFTTTPTFTSVLPNVTATAITGVVPTSDSSLAFITYTGTGGVVPSYKPQTTGAGMLGSVTLSGTAIAPVAGVFSSDNTTFYVGTSGDNQVHQLTAPKGSTTFQDLTAPIAPKLPDGSGNIVTPNLLVQHPKKAIS